MRFSSFLTGRGMSRAASVVGTTLAGAALAGCSTDSLTSVTTPDVVQPTAVQSATALPAQFNSAVGELGASFQGTSGLEGQVLYAGLLSDEILLSDTFPTRRVIDARQTELTNSNNDAVYRQMQIARVAAERAAAAYTALLPNQASQAEAYALAGYSYIFFAENYCGGVPFSTLNTDGTVTPDAAHTTADILARASAKFDTAITVATAVGSGATSQLRLAKIGKARVLVDLGQYAAAAALVTGESNVPTTYNYTLFASTNTSRQNNGVYSFNRSQRRFSVASGEGGVGLAYRATRTTSGDATVDPRVLVVRGNGSTTSGFDASPLYVAVKYSEIASPTILASGVEARLIEAEAAMNAGNYTGALTFLNTLRANTALFACPTTVTLTNFTCPASTTTPLAALTDPGAGNARVLQLFQERAFWLYLTSHRLGDMRRLVRAASASGLSGYGLPVNSVFPNGTYAPQTTLTYGAQVSLPVPYEEQSSNPKYNPSACDPTVP